MFVSPSAPTSPVEGTLWFDSNSAQTFIHYDSQWVEIGDIIDSSQTIDDLTDVVITSAAANQLLSYNGSAWINTSSPTIPGDLTVSGNISITGVQINTSSSQANDILKFDGTKYTPVPEGIFTDNILLINNGSSSTPTNNAGIEVERGNSNNVLIRWNESTDVWEFTNDGTTYRELSKTNAQVSATAPSSPYEGQIWFDSSEGGTYVYYGSNWIEVGAAPVDSLLATINAKGDLITATADDTPARLAVGATNGQVLVVDSTTATGLGYKLMGNYKPPSGGMIRPVANQGSATPAQSRLFFFPIEIASCTANLMWFGYVGTGVAGATVRGGIYDSDSSGFPGSLLLDAGTIDASTTGYKSIAINITLSSGRFWLAGVSQGGAPTVQIQTNTQMFSLGFQRSFAGFDVQYWSSLQGTNPQPLYQDNVTGALPATATPGYTNSVTSGHLIGLRIA